MQEDPVIRIVNAVLANGGTARKQGGEYKAKCPAHEDKKASLQIGAGDKGAVLHCHAGCDNKAIMAAIKLPMEALFNDYGEKHDKPADTSDQPLRAAAANAEATYIYEDEHGTVLFRVERRKGKQFVQARPDPHNPGNWLYALGDTRRVPYRLPNIHGAIKAGETIWIVEGEKDVHALEAIGLVATCNPGGAGKFRREFGDFMAGAEVVVLPDNDEPGSQHGKQVADFCGVVAHNVRVLALPGLPDKGDVSDWLTMAVQVGKCLEVLGFLDAIDPAVCLREMAAAVTPAYTNKPVIFNAESLMREMFPDVVMAVPGIIAEGCTFLVGAPKIGKSWMSLGLGLAVADGGMALGTIPVMEGKVLYLALEDTPRRLQRRLTVMMGPGTPAPANLNFACTWPRLNAGGLDQLEAWLKDNPDARMVIIDTWAKVKGGGAEAESMYQADYAAVSQVKALADEYATPIVLIHHQRKQGDGDPLNTVAGSTGLTGAADATVILTRPRGGEEGHLYVTGRDVEETKSIVSFDGTTGQWTWLGEAEDVEESRTEDSIVKLLDGSQDPMGPKDVAVALDMKEGTAKWLLAKMVQEEKIVRLTRGKYTSKTNAAATSAGPPVGHLASTVQPPLPGTGGATVPFGTVLVGDDTPLDFSEIEGYLADDEGFGGDDE